MLVVGVAIDHHSIVSPIYASFDRSLARAVLAIATQIHRQPGGQFDIMQKSQADCEKAQAENKA